MKENICSLSQRNNQDRLKPRIGNVLIRVDGKGLNRYIEAVFSRP